MSLPFKKTKAVNPAASATVTTKHEGPGLDSIVDTPPSGLSLRTEPDAAAAGEAFGGISIPDYFRLYSYVGVADTHGIGGHHHHDGDTSTGGGHTGFSSSGGGDISGGGDDGGFAMY